MNAAYTFSNRENIQILAVNNLLNEYLNKEILSKALSKIEKGFPDVIVDLSGMDFMNSVGLNFLLMLKSNLKMAGGKLAVINASDKVLRLLDVTKLRPIFYLPGSLEEALKSFSVYE